MKRKIWAFVPVLFLLTSTASDGFPDASKSPSPSPPAWGRGWGEGARAFQDSDGTLRNMTIAPAVSEVPAQGDPHRTSPGDPDKKAVPEKSKEPSPPFEDFVPSEKIDADKAVDFPVDI